MFEIFRKYLNDKVVLSDEEYSLIESVSSFKRFRKRQYLLQAGDVCRFNAFVCKGFLRCYYVDDKGGEHIMQFAPENYWTSDRESMESGLPSKYNIDALEDSEILLLANDNFERIRKTIPAFNDFVNEMLKKILRCCRSASMPVSLFRQKKNTAASLQSILPSATVCHCT